MLTGVWLVEQNWKLNANGTVPCRGFVAFGVDWPEWINPVGLIPLDPTKFREVEVEDTDSGATVVVVRPLVALKEFTVRQRREFCECEHWAGTAQQHRDRKANGGHHPNCPKGRGWSADMFKVRFRLGGETADRFCVVEAQGYCDAEHKARCLHGQEIAILSILEVV
jgi:hypothetical protein